MLSVSNLSISFEENQVLNGFNLELESGDIFALLGDSGSGKSCALRFIAGLDNAQDGSVNLDGMDLSNRGEHQVEPEARKIGMVFQDYALFPHMTVFQNICFGINKLSKEQKTEKVNELLQLICLEGVEKKYPHQLSGGEQQRVAIARALVTTPAIVWADEPTGNLDSERSGEIMNLLIQLNKAHDQAIIMVTHDDVIGRQAHRIVRMRDGQIESDEEL
mgnify:CR=1 FL=1